MDSDKIKRIKYLLKSEELYVLNNYFLYKSDIHLFRKVAAYFDILRRLPDQNRAVEGLLDPGFLAELINIYYASPDKWKSTFLYIFGEIQHPKIFKTLLAILNDQNKDPFERAKTAEALSQHHNLRAVKPLLATLTDTQPLVRAYSAKALGDCGDGRVIDPLINALKDEEVGVRCSATIALGKHKNTRALQPLLAKLHDPNLGVRLCTIEAFHSLRSSSAVQPLLAILTNENEPIEIQRQVAIVLQTYENQTIAQPSIKNLYAQDELVRISAITWLKNFGNKTALPALTELLNSKLPEKHKGERLKNIVREAIGAIEKRIQN
jgi:HEAT repeat protein